MECICSDIDMEKKNNIVGNYPAVLRHLIMRNIALKKQHFNIWITAK